MDVYERIKREMNEFMSYRKEQPNKVFIGRDLCGELGIDIYVGEKDLTCDDWIFGMKIIPTWVNDTIFVTYDKKLDNKDALIDKLMARDVEVEFKDGVLTLKKMSKELSNQIDEDFKYLQNEILFEKYYDEWCKKKDIEN